MDSQSILASVGLCWNELPYLKNLIPQLLEVSDKIILVDGFSTDGTIEYVSSLNNPKIDFRQRKFDTCANQFDFALQLAPKDNTWIYQFTADELLTKFSFDNIRNILNFLDAWNIDRMWCTLWHLRGEREMSQEVGGEIRFFRNDAHHECRFIDSPHERLDGRFDGNQITQPNKRFGFVHFKQSDKDKIEQWKTDYIEKGVYSLWDVNRRLEFPTVQLPEFVDYRINDDLRRYLNWIQA